MMGPAPGCVITLVNSDTQETWSSGYEVDLHGNQRCELALHDVATGAVPDVGELNDERHSLTLDPRDSLLVYLDNGTCAVEVTSD